MPEVAGKTADPKNRNGAVELLRILATFCIVFHHYQQLGGIYYTGGLNFYNGRFPFQYLVELFFLLSGYLAYHYQKKIECGQSFFSFIRGRIVRLFPGMILADLACYALMYFYYRHFGTYWMEIPINKWKLLITLCGMGAGWFVPGTQINGPTWYVSVLFLCLIVYFVLTKLAVRIGLPKELFYAGMVILGVGGYLLAQVLMDSCGKTVEIPFWNVYSCRGYYAFFMGLLLAKKQKAGITGRFLGSFLAMSVLSLILFLLSPGTFLSWINILLAIVIYPPFLLLLTSEKAAEKTLTWRVAACFGRMSYNVYLWHVPLYMALFVYLLRRNLYVDLTKPGVMLVYGLLSWLFGIACYYLLELPLRKAVSALWRFRKALYWDVLFRKEEDTEEDTPKNDN